ncbi:MAG: hypothetical protein CMK40_04860 [Porticoccaceae bacterium]|nr:hypothetical protein [Porticoccaceae bacterium]|tara:strand:+ start:21916 stop:22683 length:768 start_codon:yes stop_codon:yes gene_type:complete
MYMAVNELAGKRLLVIRSSRDQDEFLNMSKAAGIDVKHVPIIDINPISNDARVRQKIESLNEFDYAIFVSVHAGKIALELLDESWPKPPEALRVFTIGRQTAALLRPYISSVRYPESNADTEGLLELPEFQNPKNKNVIIFRGGHGRETLRDELISRGARVEYCDLYQRVVNQQQVEKAWEQLHNIDYLVAHSGELMRAMGPVAKITRFIRDNKFSVIVPSQRVAEIAHQLGYSSIIVSDNALPESMYEALQKGI